MGTLHDPLTGQHLQFRKTGKQTGGQLLRPRSCWTRAAMSLATCTCARTSGWRSWRDRSASSLAASTAG